MSNHNDKADFCQWELYVDDEPNLSFTGKSLGRVTSFSRQHNDTRWIELELYRTKAGKYVCERVRRTRWENEQERHEAKVCDSWGEVVEFFGYSDLAKQLYEQAGLPRHAWVRRI